MEINWIKLKDRKPSKKDRSNGNNWKFLVSHDTENWTDAAEYTHGKFWNGECFIHPTHWAELPLPVKQL